MGERSLYLGRTADGQPVECTIKVEQKIGTQTYVDHVTRAAPVRLSITWAVGRDYFGQVPSADRVVATRAFGITQATVDTIDRLWREHHLNDMQSACEHMTDEMLNPGDDVVQAWANEEQASTHRRFYGDALTPWRIDHVVCPVDGYRYGRSWLAREVPEHDLALASTIIMTGRVPDSVTA